MDAASNNSVDDIRELRESVAYAPVSGRRKVYILDEAHMLSTAAWNAFLKTLEEPPPNTVFVLATTEANKVPATVVDRCHRFDFHRPTVEQIASVVRRTAEAESIEIPAPALAALARSATGSFRDALGTLEQLVTYCGREIALEDVLAVLGVADARLLEETVDAVAEGDAGRALKALEGCVEQGRDAGSFASDLEVRARELLVVQTLGEVPGELSLTPEADSALRAQSERVDHATVVRLLELLGEAMEGVRAGADARTRLELALVKAARPVLDGSMRALLARMERLERAVAGENDYEGPPWAAGMDGAAREAASVEGERRPELRPAASAAAASAVHASVTDSSGAGAREPSGPVATRRPVATQAGLLGDDHGAPAARDLESVRSLWPSVVELVRAEHGLLGAVIVEARPVAVDGEELTLAIASPFSKKKAEDPANREAVGEALRALTGVRWRLCYELRDETVSADRPERAAHSEDEWVARFMSEFDAEELPGEGSRTPDGEDARESEHGERAVTSDEKGA